MTRIRNKNLATKKDEHYTWLVRSRSKNQRSTIKIRKTIKEFLPKIEQSERFKDVADDIIAINFSLWRAVFLSDVQPGFDHVISHALKFLDELIENNAITYNSDKGAKEWSFTYYMVAASHRLDALNRRHSDVLPDKDYPDIGNPTDKEWWEHHQKSLRNATRNFRRILKK